MDQIGSTRLVTDGNGTVVRRYDYLPSGEEIWAGIGGRTTGMSYQSAADGFNLKYTGAYRDSETYLDFMNARYYSPQQGRFVSPDPENAGADATDPTTWNGYAYVSNNPVNLTDPSGQGIFGFLWGLVGFLGGGPIGGAIGLGLGEGVDFTLNPPNPLPIWAMLLIDFITETPPIPTLGGAINGNIPGSLGGCGGPLGKCGTLGDGPWSEGTGLGNVQNPGRFIMDVNPFGADTIRYPGQSFGACMAQHSGEYSLAGFVEVGVNAATGTFTNYSNNTVVSAVLGNNISTFTAVRLEVEQNQLVRVSV